MSFQDMDPKTRRKVQAAGRETAARKIKRRRSTPKKEGVQMLPGHTKIRTKRALRNAAMVSDYAKMTAPELSQKYGLCETWVREIVHGRDSRAGKPNQQAIARAIERLKAAGYKVLAPLEMAS